MEPTHITPEGSKLAPQKVLYTMTSGRNTVYILEGYGYDSDGKVNVFELVLNNRIKSWHNSIASAQLAAVELLATL